MTKIEQLVSGKEDEKLQAEKVERTVKRFGSRIGDYISTIEDMIDAELEIISKHEELLSMTPSEFSFDVIDTALAEIRILKERKTAMEAYKKEMFK